MTRIPRQIRRHLREEGGAGSVSTEFGLMTTAVAATTVVMIAGFGSVTQKFFLDACDAIEQGVSEQGDLTADCAPGPESVSATP